jgi:16S rRNA (guanine527-N7)-methyltransferase
MPEFVPLLTEAARAASLSLDARAAERLAAYADALLALNRKINLTAARDPTQMLEVLLLPSLGVQVTWPPERAAPSRIVDLGSGNGFPGVAAAVLWPRAEVLLVERRKKKARAIGSCLAQAGIGNARALGCDAREIRQRRPDVLGAVDLVTLRAVGPLAETTALAAPLLAPGGRVVHWKGENLQPDEREAGAVAARTLGLSVEQAVPQPDGRGVFLIYARAGTPSS